MATAVYEAAPFAVYDAAASKIVSSRLVETIGAKSLAFIPLIVEERVDRRSRRRRRVGAEGFHAG